MLLILALHRTTSHLQYDALSSLKMSDYDHIFKLSKHEHISTKTNAALLVGLNRQAEGGEHQKKCVCICVTERERAEWVKAFC